MIKYKFFIDFNKEEKWLQQMAQSGNKFVSKNILGGYTFRKAEAVDTVVRIDYRFFKNSVDYQDYCALFEDSGWQHIAGTKSSGTQYFARLNHSAADDIFSDRASKAGRYKRLSEMSLTLFIIFAMFAFVLHTTGAIDLNAMINPRLLYYTPGLWQMTGIEFWTSLMFETPFAFMRGFLWVVFPVTILLFLYYAIRAHILQKSF